MEGLLRSSRVYIFAMPQWSGGLLLNHSLEKPQRSALRHCNKGKQSCVHPGVSRHLWVSVWRNISSPSHFGHLIGRASHVTGFCLAKGQVCQFVIKCFSPQSTPKTRPTPTSDADHTPILALAQLLCFRLSLSHAAGHRRPTKFLPKLGIL